MCTKYFDCHVVCTFSTCIRRRSEPCNQFQPFETATYLFWSMTERCQQRWIFFDRRTYFHKVPQHSQSFGSLADLPSNVFPLKYSQYLHGNLGRYFILFSHFLTVTELQKEWSRSWYLLSGATHGQFCLWGSLEALDRRFLQRGMPRKSPLLTFRDVHALERAIDDLIVPALGKFQQWKSSLYMSHWWPLKGDCGYLHRLKSSHLHLIITWRFCWVRRSDNYYCAVNKRSIRKKLNPA